MTLKDLRISIGCKQYQLAKNLGVATSTVCMWENGEAYPRPDKLLKLEELFGVPAGDIIRAINEAAENRKEERST